MNYGLYISASGVLTNMYRQDVYANNLANMKTTGFKADLAALMQRDPESVEDQLGMDVSNDLLDKLGGGVLAAPMQIAFNQGKLETTGQRTDVALLEADQFFAVQQQNRDGSSTIRLSRDGNLTLNSEGYLVQSNGQKILDDGDTPILLQPGLFEITSTGLVRQNDETVAQLQVTTFKDLEQLYKVGQNMLGFKHDLREMIDNPSVSPGQLESSSVDPIKAMMDVMAASKAVTGNARMIQYHDTLMNHAVNRLGKISA
ncbi:Flagellar basal-body rod protein FlgG [Poriferisphaera corsica]|uniref:Flagellar basal-body rod protein FlgG n=1 Tax=Poriferisphaera corsica TaxID=2528020 RepID=A0A517YR29_9BACT|nr:flagellar hook-basal body complex protein [Poriferisphaera corsica]QDU32685.1 Flagellar basal-body rod protein FlgG [Poriferisphaera corsica]